MKKHAKRKKVFFHHPEAETDVAGLLGRMQQQLTFLEKKIDTLIGKSSEQPFVRQHSAQPNQRPDNRDRHIGPSQDNRFRERSYHKAICADCNKECEVPFKPTGGRPVYCKECFSKRKNDAPFKEKHDSRPREETRVQERHFDKKPVGGHRRSSERKKTYSRKRK